jgi:fumarate reductase subunit C
MSRRPFQQAPSRTGWWLRQARYTRYMMREVSSLFIGTYSLVLIVGLFRLAQGQVEYDAFLVNAKGTFGILFAVVTLLFSIYHTYTWFVVTPKAMPIVIAGKRLPGVAIIAGHWAGFFIASAIVWWLIWSY